MSALDDAYKVGREAFDRSAREGVADATVPCINAFLSHLADNPPEQMVNAIAGSLKDEDWCLTDVGIPGEGPDDVTRRQLAAALSVALLSIGADK